MTPGVQYLFQLTKDDLRELANAADPKPGFLVEVNKTKNGIVIGIDKKALALAINGFFRNGGCSTNANGCLNVPFDPPN